MRLATLRLTGRTSAARLEGDVAIELPHDDVGSLLANAGGAWRELAAANGGVRHQLEAVELAAPVPHPQKIVCVGVNYLRHIEELGRGVPSHPTLFAKFSEALVGPRDPIVLPTLSASVDWEAELAMVIGSTLRHGSEAEAERAIAGFCVLNDVSMRDWQRRTLQWLQGKTFEHSTPIGPVLVTPDEIDGAADLGIGCSVDGVVMQSARTSDMLFKPARIAAYISDVITLRPGDLISTGTPGGVGEGRTPQVFLQPGQVLRTWVEGIGELVNPCVAES